MIISDFVVLLPFVNEELECAYVSNYAPSFCLDVGREANYADICYDLSLDPESVDTHEYWFTQVECVQTLLLIREKRFSVQTPGRKRRIRNQCVPGHTTLIEDVGSSHSPTKAEQAFSKLKCHEKIEQESENLTYKHTFQLLEIGKELCGLPLGECLRVIISPAEIVFIVLVLAQMLRKSLIS
nr:hypothetical protein [Tanacetum cinerariifolium]